jgi:cytochrome c oxidase subunit II
MILGMWMAPSPAAPAKAAPAAPPQGAAPAPADAPVTPLEGVPVATGEEGMPSQEAINGLYSFPWEGEGWSLLPEGSTFASGVDALYLFITGLSVFFFVLIMGAMVLFMIKHRRRSPDQKTSSITHNGKIEFLWSAIPAVLLVVIFLWGEIDFLKQSVPPNDAIDIRVTGQKWSWTVSYPDKPGVILTSSNTEPRVTMVVPKGRPVRLTMTSKDVIHSFFVPVLRVKRDVVPGRYTNLWFEATQVGEFNLYCAEYCGDQHSRMTGLLKVVEPEQYDAVLEELGKLEQEAGEPLPVFGKRVYELRGCPTCHSVDGEAKVGPTWKGLWGKTESMTDGTSVTLAGADGENYIRQSILEPNAKVVSGFQPQMPSYQGQLEDAHIEALIAYIKTLEK